MFNCTTNLHSGDKNGCEGHFQQIDIDNKDSSQWTCIIWQSDGVWGASKGETRESRGRKRREKKLSVARPDKDGLVGPSFLRFSGYHKKPQKRRKHFRQGLPPFPDPHLSAFPDSTKLRATFSDRVFISATGNQHKIQRWRDAGPFRDVFVFSDFKVCSHYFHALRANNLIQQSFVTFFVSFLTDVLIGSCFLPQQFSPARIICACLCTCYTCGSL